MKYSVRPTTKFQKDLKRVQRRGYDLSLLTDIIKKLAEGETLPDEQGSPFGWRLFWLQGMSYHAGLVADL